MFVFLFVFCALSALLGQEDTLSDSLNMRLVGVWEASTSLHGLAAIDSFAYTIGEDTLFVLCLSHPDSPYVCGSLVGSWGGDVFGAGNLICTDGRNEEGINVLKVVDVSEPNHPFVAGSLAIPNCLLLGFADSLAVGKVSGRNEFIFIDIAEPSSPVLLDTFSSPYFSDSGPDVCRNIGYSPRLLSLSGHYLHLGGARSEWDSGIGYWIDYGEYYCFNISEPTEPTLVRYIDFGMFTDVWALASIEDIGFIGLYPSGSIPIFRVSVCSGTQSLIGYNRIESMASADGFLAVSGRVSSGEWYISVWYTSNPCALRLVGYYKTAAFPIQSTIFRDTLFVLGYVGDGIEIYAAPLDTLGVQGRADERGGDRFSLYPNPAPRGASVWVDGAGVVYDITGRSITEIAPNSMIDTSKLKPGIYIILPKNGKPQKLVIIG